MRARKLNDAQIEQIVARREAGWSCRRIAGLFSVSEGAIQYQCLKNGAVSPAQYRRAVPTVPAITTGFGGRTQRLFTQAEDARLLELEAKGLGYSALARELGRPRTSVRVRLLTLASYEDRALHPAAPSAPAPHKAGRG